MHILNNDFSFARYDKVNNSKKSFSFHLMILIFPWIMMYLLSIKSWTKKKDENSFHTIWTKRKKSWDSFHTLKIIRTLKLVPKLFLFTIKCSLDVSKVCGFKWSILYACNVVIQMIIIQNIYFLIFYIYSNSTTLIEPFIICNVVIHKIILQNNHYFNIFSKNNIKRHNNMWFFTDYFIFLH